MYLNKRMINEALSPTKAAIIACIIFAAGWIFAKIDVVSDCIITQGFSFAGYYVCHIPGLIR